MEASQMEEGTDIRESHTFLFLTKLSSWYLLLYIASGPSKRSHVAKWQMETLCNNASSKRNAFLYPSLSTCSVPLIIEDHVFFLGGLKKMKFWCSDSLNRLDITIFLFLTLLLSTSVQGLTVANNKACFLSKTKKKTENLIPSVCCKSLVF